ncbi:PiggyBac transposable element-derived protein 4 [Elysia marginata]|uniref:PiggyBac transposable element-derived protein 4 n=1 Tax=Elysia marginata TaxID=1093978 RepID=A0AAV4JGX3_9GAST|nr:PiggyBac transposable element-derived protein 4 [Elysia marginata]
MNGCDLADQQTGYYGVFERKPVKWWKKLFYFMFEICVTNSHILHTLAKGQSSSLLEHKKKLFNVRSFEALAVATRTDEDRKRDEARQRGRPSATIMERFVGNSHFISYKKNDSPCAYCNEPGAAKKKRTNFFCNGCSTKPHLHAKHCFERYHTEAYLHQAFHQAFLILLVVKKNSSCEDDEVERDEEARDPNYNPSGANEEVSASDSEDDCSLTDAQPILTQDNTPLAPAKQSDEGIQRTLPGRKTTRKRIRDEAEWKTKYKKKGKEQWKRVCNKKR